MNTTLPNTQYHPSKRRQNTKTRQQSQTSQQPSTMLYNLKDFLPQSSTIVQSRNITLQNRNKTRSTIIQQSSFIIKGNPENIVHNVSLKIISKVEQRVIEQKMNKLKQTNSQLHQTVDQQKSIITKQQQEIQRLKSELKNMKLAQETKAKRLTIWNYKYHAEYAPKQSIFLQKIKEYKYSLAVQTVDEGYSRGNVIGTTSLRAKDFEDIYRRLNSSAPIDAMKKKVSKQQGIASNISGIPNNKSSLGMTQKNPNMALTNNKPTLKLTKFFLQNRSQMNSKINEHQFIPNDQVLNNKENMMSWSNLNFDMNPMSINLQKIRKQEKPIKQQCIEIYPVDQEYLEGIIGEILCSED